MDPRYKSPTTALAEREDEYEFRDLTTLSSALVWMLRIGAVLAVVGIWSSWLQFELVSRDFTQMEADANDQRQALIFGVTAVLMLATMIVFGIWIVRAHRNLPALGAQYLEVRPGWALGFFFIPILNWWKPYQAMRSLWRSSHSVNRPELQESTWVLPVWWTLWVIYSLIGNKSWSAPSKDSAQLDLAENAIYLVLCIVASLVVSRIWQAQSHQRDNPEEAPRGFADAPA